MATPLFTVELGLASSSSDFTLDLTQLSPATSPAVDAPLGFAAGAGMCVGIAWGLNQVSR